MISPSERAFLLVIGSCARGVAPEPDFAATALSIDAGADASEASADPFGGNPPPEPADAGPSPNPKCVQEKHEGWGTSGGGCGTTLKYRCGMVRYEVACAHGPRGAICECKENGKLTGTVQQPKERCGNATDGADVCGFPHP